MFDIEQVDYDKAKLVYENYREYEHIIDKEDLTELINFNKGEFFAITDNINFVYYQIKHKQKNPDKYVTRYNISYEPVELSVGYDIDVNELESHNFILGELDDYYVEARLSGLPKADDHFYGALKDFFNQYIHEKFDEGELDLETEKYINKKRKSLALMYIYSNELSVNETSIDYEEGLFHSDYHKIARGMFNYSDFEEFNKDCDLIQNNSVHITEKFFKFLIMNELSICFKIQNEDHLKTYFIEYNNIDEEFEEKSIISKGYDKLSPTKKSIGVRNHKQLNRYFEEFPDKMIDIAII